MKIEKFTRDLLGPWSDANVVCIGSRFDEVSKKLKAALGDLAVDTSADRPNLLREYFKHFSVEALNVSDISKYRMFTLSFIVPASDVPTITLVRRADPIATQTIDLHVVEIPDAFIGSDESEFKSSPLDSHIYVIAIHGIHNVSILIDVTQSLYNLMHDLEYCYSPAESAGFHSCLEDAIKFEQENQPTKPQISAQISDLCAPHDTIEATEIEKSIAKKYLLAMYAQENSYETLDEDETRDPKVTMLCDGYRATLDDARIAVGFTPEEKKTIFYRLASYYAINWNNGMYGLIAEILFGRQSGQSDMKAIKAYTSTPEFQALSKLVIKRAIAINGLGIDSQDSDTYQNDNCTQTSEF